MKNSIRSLSSFIFFLAIIMMNAQEGNEFMKKSFKRLPDIRTDKSQQRYRMTTVYINRDLTGNFTGKTMVSGEYTRGLPGDSARWNNAYISESQVFDAAFPAGRKLDYMENSSTFLPRE